MNITPNEISNKDFKKVFRGYDMDEVDEFLDALVEDYEKLFKENINLKDKITVQEEKLEHYSSIETTLQNTLLLAQTTADQVKENSKKEIEMLMRDANENAGSILKKANENAESLIKTSEDKAMDLNREFEKVKQDYELFKTRFIAMLEAQVDSMNKSSLDL
jgi:cell division initiation protein